MVNYYFDTYAIIELLKRNPAYEEYNQYPLITTLLNKIELHWWALNAYGVEFGDIILNSIQPQDITDDIIRMCIQPQ